VTHYNRLYVRKEGGSVAWNDGLTADYFECTTTNTLAFTFESGKVFDLRQFYLNGLVGNAAKLALSASQTGTRWLLKTTASQRVAGVTVADSDATGGTTVYAGAPSSGNGNTPGWDFGNACSEWTGKAGDGKFATAGNWSDGVVPGPTSRVAIACAEGASLTIAMPTSDLTLSNLVVGVGGGTVNLMVNGALSVVEDIDFREKAAVTFNTKKTCSAGRDVTLRSGASVTHAVNGTAENYAVNVTAGGNFTIGAGAKVTADEKGYTKDTTIYPAHGGSDRDGHACYDSVFTPVLSGRAGNRSATPGGGVIRLTVTGTLSVFGDVTANGNPDYRNVLTTGGYDSGAGGSVLIACRNLVGNGLIAACAGTSWHTGQTGGGGRVAIRLTDPSANFDDFLSAGSILALYGRNDQYKGTGNTGGSGTVSLRTADGSGEIRIGDIQNNPKGLPESPTWTDLPMADDGSPTRAYRQQTLTLGPWGRLRLTGDLTIDDLALSKCANTGAYATNISLRGYTLTIRSRVHKDGKGWYEGWEKWVDKGVNPDTGAPGKIVWRAGLALIIR